MAVGNIRERLQLHFDVAAELTTRVGDSTYEVRIAMPYAKPERS
jgi:two-component system sensor histidine kinase AlgZ